MYRGATIWARKTIESDVFFLKPDKWFKIWFYLISRVNYEDKGKFKRGEALVRYADISEACGATKSQVDHAIRWLKKCQMLATRKATRGMFVTIVNYSTYQDLESYKSDTNGDLEAKQKRNRSDTKDKKTKKANKTKKKDSVIFPPELDTLDFRKTWDAWVQFRIEKKVKLTPSTIKVQLKKLSKLPVLTATAMINQSIEQGWQGLFQLKENCKPKPEAPKADQDIAQWEARDGQFIREAEIAKVKELIPHKLANPKYMAWAVGLRPELEAL